ncbi:signal recognition particle-docking protein FtsY [Candidatus Pantoea multigeneris]|uniref:Signal recognition particle receptor FtsY n=1 Tax=Candidatus Pantoea multigeneris TaxID=2608357 RepID=A0ABX0RIG3_9GAMM|nr:signal recognition particle-docking protein FtsY [Pantoea multigeneris]NIF24272.1 signal recognition particle-docking protein FtsY [Pantoea multigeneris]
MAKEKKRGFFSWLGFGKEEKEQPAAEQQAPEQAEVAQEAETHHPVEEQREAALAEVTASEPVEVVQTQPEAVAEPVEPAVAEPVVAEPVEPEIAHTPAEPEAVAVSEIAEPAVAEPVEPEVAHTPAEPEAVAVSEVAEPVVAEPVEPEVAHTPAEPEAVAVSEVAEPAVAEPVEPEVAHTPAEPEAVAASEVAEPELIAEEAEEALTEDELAELALAEAPQDDAEENSVGDLPLAPIVPTEQARPTKEGFFSRLKRSLVKTRQNLGSGFMGLFRGKKIDDDLFEELEEQLLIADVGVETTRRIITNLTQQANRKQLRDAEALYGLLKAEMAGILAKVDEPLDVGGKMPFVILMVGVNGVGKTTTIGKLARQYQAEGKSVMLAAGDTFRAAAVEQLQVWGQRNNIPVVAQHTGADSASVIFDAIQAAKARNVDVLIADTAGRLQNKSHLMEELKKITRVMKKLDEDAPHEVMLTLDASTGQNAVSQAKLFNEAVGLTGIALTKLDGTAKGGVIFSIADQFGIPIRYIGVGEGIEDLRPFKAEDFIEALFARED